MVWDDEEDSFFANVDLEALTRQHSRRTVDPPAQHQQLQALPIQRVAVPQQQQQQQQQVASNAQPRPSLRSLFMGSRPMQRWEQHAAQSNIGAASDGLLRNPAPAHQQGAAQAQHAYVDRVPPMQQRQQQPMQALAERENRCHQQPATGPHLHLQQPQGRKEQQQPCGFHLQQRQQDCRPLASPLKPQQVPDVQHPPFHRPDLEQQHQPQHQQHQQQPYQQQQQYQGQSQPQPLPHRLGGANANSNQQTAGSGPMHPRISGPAVASASSGQNGGPMLFIAFELKEQSVEVNCAYNDIVSTQLKRIPGSVWEPRNRRWHFPLVHHDRVAELLQGLKNVRVKLEMLHPIVTAVLRSFAAQRDESSRYCHIPAALEQQLMPFQREGVKFALKRGARLLIADEMGLGKTVQAICIAAAFRDEWPVLVIAPSSLREAWADALHRWLGICESEMHVVHSGKDASRVPANISFLICSYNFVQKMDLAKRFSIVILDESHSIKDGNAQRTKATVPLVREARRAILLSGTPALNRPKELFQQLAALCPGAKLKMRDFGERYCQGNHFDKYGGASNLAELNALLKNTVMIRRLKLDVLAQLPSKRRQQVFLVLDADAKRALNGLQRQLEVVRQVMAEEARMKVASAGAASRGMADKNKTISELYMATAQLKVKAVQDYVQLLLDSGQKFLIFAHHRELMDGIEHTCNRTKGLKFIRIDGQTPAVQRQSLVNSFQDNQDVRVAILSIRAAGTGLTLTAASTVVFAELTWVPGEIIQAEDRAHRIGQASSVNIYFLHAKGSVDDLIWSTLQNKLDAVGEALDGQGQALDARRMQAPERGQAMLHSFLTQSKPEQAAVMQQQQQQPPTGTVAVSTVHPGNGTSIGKKGNTGGASGHSPSKGQQLNLHQFFSGSSRQQQHQQQQQQRPPGQQHLQYDRQQPIMPYQQQRQQQQQTAPQLLQQQRHVGNAEPAGRQQPLAFEPHRLQENAPLQPGPQMAKWGEPPARSGMKRRFEDG